MEDISGGITAPLGFKAGVAKCGIKQPGRYDLALIVSEVPAVCAGVFTSNRIKAAPVLVSRERVKRGVARAIVANSGNANACTGENGIEAALSMAGETAKLIGCDPQDILVASTGVIGRVFPIEKIVKCLPQAVENLTVENGSKATRAIMTTDTVPKETSVKIMIGDTEVMIGAIAKGAGMICPDMATLLCFITTDADIEHSALKKAITQAVGTSFNCITVDGDMSTNDTLLVLANGKAENQTIRSRSKSFETFAEALSEVCLRMAKAIVSDGEGATKFITLKVTGATGKEDARQTGLTIANSPLVKTAFFGNDPNWGRIICAAGYSGVPIYESSITITLNGNVLFENGSVRKFNDKVMRESMAQKEQLLEINLGMGKAEATIYTTDLSYEYVKINAEYTT